MWQRHEQNYALESDYQIQQHIQYVIHRMRPRFLPSASADIAYSTISKSSLGYSNSDIIEKINLLVPGQTIFRASHPDAIPPTSFQITSVLDPMVGETTPQAVFAESIIDLSRVNPVVKQQWDITGRDSVLFFVSVEARVLDKNWRRSVPQLDHDPVDGPTSWYNITHRRAAVDKVIDKITGRILIDGKYAPVVTDTGSTFSDHITGEICDNPLRIYKLRLLDTEQYILDIEKDANFYKKLDIVVRRDDRENSFFPVLTTIHRLGLSKEKLFPKWMISILQGKFKKTLAQNFSSVTAKKLFKTNLKIVKDFCSDNSKLTKIVDFTDVQQEAIARGLGNGLVLIVGPPGTGKTDVTVEMVNLLHHQNPQERILILTHSNQAINDIFEKLIALKIDSSIMLRLGHGAEYLKSEDEWDRNVLDFRSNPTELPEITTKIKQVISQEKEVTNFIDTGFSKVGRINKFLIDRLEILYRLTEIAQNAGYDNKYAFPLDCYTAQVMYTNFLRPMLEARAETSETPESHESGPTTNVELEEEEEDENIDSTSGQENKQPNTKVKTDTKFKYPSLAELDALMAKLDTYRPLEILLHRKQRGNYLLTNQAKIICMTVTHAAIKQEELSELGFTFDSLILEESSQMLQVESMIPITLQKTSFKKHRMKRMVMIGDHMQLSPILANPELRNTPFSKSLFEKLIELNYPYCHLNSQGRSRPEIADLWRWRYDEVCSASASASASTKTSKKTKKTNTLKDLPHTTMGRFLLPNPGFSNTFQFINVGEYRNKGEEMPKPYYYQNRGEAEFIVSTFILMKLLHYPTKSIAILSTYRGQVDLINEILSSRYASTPMFDIENLRVSTVDKFQGQQSDYVLLSLVRTERTVGHLQDLKRLTVALSRARLGLYIFGRKSHFESHPVLKSTLDSILFKSTSQKLQICLGEDFSSLDSNSFPDSESRGQLAEYESPEEIGELISFLIKSIQVVSTGDNVDSES